MFAHLKDGNLVFVANAKDESYSDIIEFDPEEVGFGAYAVEDGKVVLIEPPKEIEEKGLVEYLKKELMRLCDKKQRDAEVLILGYKATPKQVERYKDKYERAKEGGFEDAVNAAIIQKHETARSKISYFIDLIEEYREFVDDLIQAGEIDKAGKALEAGQPLGADTTREDILEILGGL